MKNCKKIRRKEEGCSKENRLRGKFFENFIDVFFISSSEFFVFLSNHA